MIPLPSTNKGLFTSLYIVLSKKVVHNDQKGLLWPTFFSRLVLLAFKISGFCSLVLLASKTLVKVCFACFQNLSLIIKHGRKPRVFYLTKLYKKLRFQAKKTISFQIEVWLFYLNKPTLLYLIIYLLARKYETDCNICKNMLKLLCDVKWIMVYYHLKYTLGRSVLFRSYIQIFKWFHYV